MSETKIGLAEETPAQKRERLGRLLREKAQQRSERFPLSFGQQRLWFLDELEGGNTIAYNIPVVLRLYGRVDVQTLERSLGEVIRRHEALRTTFRTNPNNGEPEQVIQSWSPFAIEVINLGERKEEDREAEARRLAREEGQRPFSLSNGPLIRARLLTLDPTDDHADHVLLLTMHHIVSDGWSVGVLMKELATLYENYLKCEESPLPDLPVQYVDFAHWQRNRLTGEVLDQQLSYWRAQLGGQLPVLELPTLGSRPPRHTIDGAVRVWNLPREIADKARTLSQGEGVTLFMTLVAIFKVLLNRYTGQEDILVGTPIANRNRRETEGLIGLFINTLVLRTDLSGQPTFRELLKRVREVCLGAYAHQDVPFEKLVEDLHPDRDLSRTPVFQVMFVMQNALAPALRMGDVVMSPWIIEGATSKFDVTLSIMEEEDGHLSGWLEYNTNLFDDEMIERMIDHYETLLESAAARPDQRISRLPILGEFEREQLLIEWNRTACDYSLDKCLHELFEEQSKLNPQHDAVIFEGRSVSYRELNRLANGLAWQLRGLGVGPEVLIGLSMERSVEMVVAILGVMKAGGSYVPLDPTYPRDRLAFMLEDSGVTVLLTQSHLCEQLPKVRGTVLCLDSGWRPAEEAEDTDPVSDARPESIAYVIYTSGSTGRPKGVMTPHRAACNMVLWMQAAYHLTPSDRILQKTAFSFDAAVWEFLWPLLFGGTLIVARPYADKDVSYMVDVLRTEKVTLLQLVPSLLRVLVEQEGFDKCRDLRHVFCGGEALPAAVCDRFFDSLPNARLTNVYGPTETTMHVTVWDCERQGRDGVAPIGRPVGNTTAYVLNEQGQPAPIAVPGELYIGGSQVARGYLNRPELTAEKFVPDPCGGEAGSRLYRTGDLARLRSDGGIEFLGRIDHQVKIRGYRIELGEIETVLRQHSAISETIVMAREDVPGDKRLVAYLVPAPGEDLKIGELRGFLLSKLPDYMAPSTFVTLESFPLMSNGKVDRGSLPPPDSTRQDLEQEYVAPRNGVEEAVAMIFAEILKIDKIGVEDNFFLLGGHSLSATQVITRVRDTLQADVPLRRVFETPTVAGLAVAVEEFRSHTEENRIEVISHEQPDEAEPLSTLLEKLSREELEALLMDVATRKMK